MKTFVTTWRFEAARRAAVRVWLPVATTTALVLGALATGPARAQDGELDEQSKKLIQSLGGDKLKQAEEVMKATRSMGWDRQHQLLDQATEQMFDQNGWNSEPDQFTRNLLRDVGQIPPWQAQQRQEAFLNAIQGRLSLTHDQRMLLNTEIQRESIQLTVKHFKDIVPVVLEVAKTRAADEPFTPEQVQRWTKSLGPMLNESLEVVQRVSQRLERTMTEDQRRQLKADMDALVRRHRDVEKLMQKWQRGEWSPADWGLQNDPAHAGLMQALSARGGAATLASTDAAWKDPAFANNETEWERYVKWFCEYYECDASQRTKADSILKTAKQEAIRYRESRRDVIAQYEVRLATEKDAATRVSLTAELNRNLAPIGELFTRMKDRLHADVLTSSQRRRMPEPARSPSTTPAGAAEKAVVEKGGE
jgi:hypothetical protein